jgi:hypothetical protein
VTIRKGEAWGAPGSLPADAPVAEDDAQAAAELQRRWGVDGAAPTDPPHIGLLGGDLHRTVGEPHHDEHDLRSGQGMCLPMDAATVRLDGGAPQVFVAQLIATADRRGRLWHGRTITVVNGSFAGPYDLGPRAHPNDGRLDLVDGELPPRQRRMGRRRALTGSHLPHPDLTERRTAHHVVESDRVLHVRLDDVDVGVARRLEITCHPDAWIAVV